MLRQFTVVTFATSLLLALPAHAQVQVQVDVPTVTFGAPPPLEVVEPGIQVVPGQPEEVFLMNGWYWTRHGGRWYRTRDYHGGWVFVDRRAVPGHLWRIPPGRYANWHREGERRELRHEERHEERMERHERREGY